MINGIKDSLVKVVRNLRGIDPKKFDQYTYLGLGVVLLLAGFLHYSIYTKSTILHHKIKTLQGLAKKTSQLVEGFELLAEEEKRLGEILAKQGDFHIKIYFEQLCKDKNLNSHLLQSGWDIKTEELNDTTVEESVTAGFQGMTTELLVNLLQEIDKQELLYVKNLRIKPDKDKKIAFDFTIATIKNK